MPTEPSARRPLTSRDLSFFRSFAEWLARAGVTPNAISFFSIVFAFCAAATLAATGQVDGVTQRACWLVAALGIQARLMANMLDGMVAVEGKKGGPTGELWNEVPDRISDAAIFIGAGYAAGSSPLLGFAAALTAVFVAYTRALGASIGAGQCFHGPQSKPQRMAVMTGACVLIAALPVWQRVMPISIIALALWIVVIGGAVTAWRRMTFVAAFLRDKGS